MSEKKCGCACGNCGPECKCNAERKPGECCCGPECKCGPNCGCPASCGCPSAKK